MTVTPDMLKRHLADGAALTQSVQRSSEAIQQAARERREVVAAKLAELTPRVHTDKAAADEYEAMIAERGRLDLVLAG